MFTTGAGQIGTKWGMLIFFPPGAHFGLLSPLIKKGSIILWIFLIKEDHVNYSMHEESLLAYLHLLLLIKKKSSVFIVRLIAFK